MLCLLDSHKKKIGVHAWFSDGVTIFSAVGLQPAMAGAYKPKIYQKTNYSWPKQTHWSAAKYSEGTLIGGGTPLFLPLR